jgi:histidinol phosphatase-like PHP family hydrolase
MNRPYSRRRFLESSLMAGAALAGRPISGAPMAREAGTHPPAKPSFPVADYHVHLSPALSIAQAIALGHQRQVHIGILAHPGPSSQINTDADLKRYIDSLRKYPVRIGLQPVYAGWSKSFSKSALDELDYVLMDALTLPRPEGGWLEIWQIDTMVDDAEEFMGRYMRFIEQVLTTEPIDVFGWPTFLPVPIARLYKELWTPQRVQRIISLCRDRAQGPRDRKIAIEINEVAHVPDESFILQAKQASLKFTFGTDARNQNAAHFYYCYQMAQKCGLTETDMFVPGGLARTS